MNRIQLIMFGWNEKTSLLGYILYEQLGQACLVVVDSFIYVYSGE